MRKLILLFCLLFAACPPLVMHAQINITAKVQDQHGSVYANGFYDIDLVVPANATQVPLYGGSVFQQRYVGDIDSLGYLGGASGIYLFDNNLITDGLSPSGTQWKFSICMTHNTPWNGLPCFNTTLTITGASPQDISAQLTAASALLNPTGGGGGVVVYNVQGYGVNVGQGTIADLPAENLAIAACNSNGGTVYYPPGTYLQTATPTAINVPKCNVQGEGRASTLISTSGVPPIVLLKETIGIDTAQHNGFVRDLSFDCNPGAVAPPGRQNTGLWLVNTLAVSHSNLSFNNCDNSIVIENTALGFSERLSFDTITLENFTRGITFKKDPTGDVSFAHNSVSNLWFNTSAPGDAVFDLEGQAFVGDGSFTNLNGNFGAGSGNEYLFLINGGSYLWGNFITAMPEGAGSGGTQYAFYAGTAGGVHSYCDPVGDNTGNNCASQNTGFLTTMFQTEATPSNPSLIFGGTTWPATGSKGWQPIPATLDQLNDGFIYQRTPLAGTGPAMVLNNPDFRTGLTGWATNTLSSGTASISGPTVTRLTGDLYALSWSGNVVLGSVTATILSVDSPSQITLTTSPGDQASVAFSYGVTATITQSKACSGLATSSGSTLTWAGGCPFDTTMTGSITYNSSPFTISSVIAQTSTSFAKIILTTPSGTHGATAFLYNAAASPFTNGTSMKITTTQQSGGVYSQQAFEVSPGDPILLKARFVTDGTFSLQGSLQFQDGSGGIVSYGTAIGPTTSTSWAEYSSTSIVPANAVSAAIIFGRQDAGGGTHSGWVTDIRVANLSFNATLDLSNLTTPTTIPAGTALCSLDPACITFGPGWVQLPQIQLIPGASINSESGPVWTVTAHSWDSNDRVSAPAIFNAITTATNTDNRGHITLSGGSGSYTFTQGPGAGGIWTTAPVCQVQDQTFANQGTTTLTVTATSLTIANAAGTGADVYSYICSIGN